MTDVDDAFGHYLAGLIDGEGSFQIAQRGTTHSPKFRMAVIERDGWVLEEAQRRTECGYITRNDRNDGRRRPLTVWIVARKEDCRSFAEILKRYPPRGPKAPAFEIWYEAVIAWADRDGHRGKSGPREPHPVQDRLRELRSQLHEVTQ